MNDYSEEFKRDDRFWNGVGISCGTGIIICLIVIFFMLIANVRYANAGWCDDWNIYFFGIDIKDLEGRKWYTVAGGAVMSFVVHEAGHLVAGELVGMDTSWDNDEKIVWAEDYWDKSDDQKALYHGGGFIAQTLVGGILTAIPKTRHWDFTVGFNGFAFVNNLHYGITGGRGKEEYSDVHNLDRYGYDGTAIGVGAGVISGVFTYINLDKHK